MNKPEAADTIEALNAEHIASLGRMADLLSAEHAARVKAEGELTTIARHLDQNEIGVPVGTINHTLTDRVLVACIAATDEEDRTRALAAEAREATLVKALAEIERQSDQSANPFPHGDPRGPNAKLSGIHAVAKGIRKALRTARGAAGEA